MKRFHHFIVHDETDRYMLVVGDNKHGEDYKKWSVLQRTERGWGEYEGDMNRAAAEKLFKALIDQDPEKIALKKLTRQQEGW